MVQKYNIEGMTCGGCVASVKRALENLPNVEEANIQLQAPQGLLKLKHPVEVGKLQAAIGHYKISEIKPSIVTE